MKRILTLATFAFLATAIGLTAENNMSRGSYYWTADRSSPDATLEGVIDAIHKRDYCRLYALVSMDVVTDMKKMIIRASHEIWGAPINPLDIVTSEFGSRYGNVAFFEEVLHGLSSIEGSWVYQILQYERDVFVSGGYEHIKIADGRATIAYNTQETAFVFNFIQSADKWYLDNVSVNDSAWRTD